MGAKRRLREPVGTDPIVWMDARKQRSLRKNKRPTSGDEVTYLHPHDSRRPPQGGTAQAQTGGVYGNDPLELILIRSGIAYAYV